MPFDSTLDPTTDVILGAITYLETHGWQKGGCNPHNPDGPGCIREAIYRAANGYTHIAHLAVLRVKKANGITIDIPFWNDAQERTKEQVLDALHNSLVMA